MGRTWRFLAILTLFLCSTLAGGTIWMLAHPAVTSFVVPGATNIQIARTEVWEWQVTYDAPGPPYAWYFMLQRILDTQQWSDRSPIDPTRFAQISPRWFVRDNAQVLWDEVKLTPDDHNPQRATITLRRHLRMPWWPYWSPTGDHGAISILSAVTMAGVEPLRGWHHLSAASAASSTQQFNASAMARSSISACPAAHAVAKVSSSSWARASASARS